MLLVVGEAFLLQYVQYLELPGIFGSSPDEVLIQGCPCNAYVGGTRLPRNSANRPPSGTMDCFGPDGEVAGPENRGTPYLQTHVCAYLFLAHISFGCWHFRPRVALKAARSFGFFVRVHGRPTCLEMGFVQGTCDSNASTG